METFLIERVVPPTFAYDDPEQLARHCRLAADAYRRMGCFWLGGVITNDGMYSLATAESEADLRTYWRSIGVADNEIKIRKVLQPLGPFLATPRPASNVS